MALNIPNRVIVFDYGEVISHSPSERDRVNLVATAGALDAEFWGPYWAHRDRLDGGSISVRDYWKLVATDLGVDFSESRIHELWVADYTSWLSINPETFDVIADLSAGGTRIALLSNAGFDFASPFRLSPIASYFERVFISAEIGMLKPNPEIYLEVLRELGITPAEMVFIDNKQENVAGAKALGIIGHVFASGTTLRAFLEKL